MLTLLISPAPILLRVVSLIQEHNPVSITPQYSPDITFGNIMTMVAAAVAAAAAWYSLKGRVSNAEGKVDTVDSKIDDLTNWKHEHEQDAKARDLMLQKIDGLAQSSIRRLELQEKWSQDHGSWASAKSEQLIKVQEAMVSISRLIDMEDSRIKQLELEKRKRQGDGG